MEEAAQNSAQTSDQSQPIQELEGDDDKSKIVGGSVDVVDGGLGGLELELGSSGAEMVKKKRGRPPRVQAKSPPPTKMTKEEDEDVCFICFDGGSLVLCDRRGCPKAYHPACVKRDEAFFRSKAKWNCGWHICSMCQKAAHHMCYTCTYSLCKSCIKKADYVCVRGDKGFCTWCMKTIMLIENDDKAQVDFDDKTSWEYLFKVYWVYLKGKLSLTLDELTQAKNPYKRATTDAQVSSSTTCVHNGGNNDLKNITSVSSSTTCVHNGGNNDLKNITSEIPVRNLEANESKRRKTDEQIISISAPVKETAIVKKPPSPTDDCSWATKELLDFVSHMKNGDSSVLTQYDVQELMLEYIKRNNLRDPRKKSQIVCDSRLKSLFGKPRVAHFEMLKLLEFHFFIKEDSPKNTISKIGRQVDPDWNIDSLVTLGKNKKKKNHKKSEGRPPPQNNLDEYAAIDVHNMNLVYLRRKLMENLIEDRESFHGKVVGSIVRIRISASDQKHDMYRLVQVVGTSKADAPYKIGDKSADVVLEVLNLDKKETVSIDTISNQDLSQDECRRLRQSIKCGLVKRFTVGEIQEKAVSLQSVRLNDWMEAEILRLNNLRDRASEKGHKKGLREYVEKLQLLKTPEERERRLREIPEVHSDPKMNPDYETDDAEEYFNEEQEHKKPKYSGVSRKNTSTHKKQSEFPNNVSGRSWKNELLEPKVTGRIINMAKDGHRSSSSVRPQNAVDTNGSTAINQNHRTLNSVSETATSSSHSTRNTVTSNDSDMDKVWHYRDPSGKIQGPFCMIQLQKWSTTGYFPVDMRIWLDQEDESLLLNDVLKEQSQKTLLTENKTITPEKVGKVSNRMEGLTVHTANPLTTEKSSDSHGSSGQSSLQNRDPPFAKSNESTVELASPTPVENNPDIKRVSSVFDIGDASLVDLPSPTPKNTSNQEEEKVQDKEKVQDTVNLTSEENVSGAHILKTSDEWTGYSPTQAKPEEWNSRGASVSSISASVAEVKPEEWNSGGASVSSISAPVVAEVKHEEWNSGGVSVSSISAPVTEGGDQVVVATTAANIEQIIHSSPPPPSLLPAYSCVPSWNGDVRETIEFSTLAEESVSDLLEAVETMESQNGFPSPTSRRNSFVEDLFNGSFEEFSPTPGSRNHVFSSSGPDNIQLPFSITTTTVTATAAATTAATDEHAVVTSQANNSIPFLQQSNNVPFKWPEMPLVADISVGGSSELPPPDVNSSAKAEADKEQESAQLTNTNSENKIPEPENRTQEIRSGGGVAAEPLPPPSFATGSDKIHQPRVGSEATQLNMSNFIRPALETTTRVNPHLNADRGGNVGWDPHQRMFGGGDMRYNSNIPRERIFKVEDSGYNNNNIRRGRQLSFGSGGSGGGYTRPLPPPPTKGQRVCKFYESGRCKKGASCNYWHP